MGDSIFTSTPVNRAAALVVNQAGCSEDFLAKKEDLKALIAGTMKEIINSKIGLQGVRSPKSIRNRRKGRMDALERIAKAEKYLKDNPISEEEREYTKLHDDLHAYQKRPGEIKAALNKNAKEYVVLQTMRRDPEKGYIKCKFPVWRNRLSHPKDDISDKFYDLDSIIILDDKSGILT